MSGCCSPGRDGDNLVPRESLAQAPRVDRPLSDAISIPGGRFEMGAVAEGAHLEDGEGPIHTVELQAYRISATCVTNDEFSRFVAATGYVTESERYGWSFVFAGLLPDDFEPTSAVAAAPWWRVVHGTDWRHPEGPQSGISARGDHPVVHVSWHDAAAYCEWIGARLPTEAEWEYAARGGRSGAAFPWGNELVPGKHMMNVFQGQFPAHNSADDGWIGTAPVAAYDPNGYGIYNATGNVWEWCSDWYSPDFYRESPGRNPAGPSSGITRVQRGGSYLCHASYCNRYRVAARSGNTPDSAAGNVGFRIAYRDQS
jgi:formylglycine-generating enzyme